ncbi:hypothetical protein [Streptomyces sp. NPDC002779]|uniref:hypothetical protein n=1 Tax=Streptomyces sp. NPDC002779 TaxID=3364664 RepID=UPI0036BEE1B0
MGRAQEHYDIRFEPTRLVSRQGAVVLTALALVMWVVAIWLALLLLGREHILEQIFFVAGVSFAVAWIVLLGGVWLRRREERREPR